jgi:hypothetical protein
MHIFDSTKVVLTANVRSFLGNHLADVTWVEQSDTEGNRWYACFRLDTDGAPVDLPQLEVDDLPNAARVAGELLSGSLLIVQALTTAENLGKIVLHRTKCSLWNTDQYEDCDALHTTGTPQTGLMLTPQMAV